MVHLPAVNTPQFEWARNRLPRRPQPVPPVHDPEVAAAAIVRAATDAPRELWVGSPTMQAILGTMAAPGSLDRLMARRAWDGQMTSEPAQDRPDNLFAPVEGDRGARGRFGPAARRHAIVEPAGVVRGALAGAGFALLAGAAAFAFRRGANARERLPSRSIQGARASGEKE
jgi:hypothetical protein